MLGKVARTNSPTKGFANFVEIRPAPIRFTVNLVRANGINRLAIHYPGKNSENEPDPPLRLALISVGYPMHSEPNA